MTSYKETLNLPKTGFEMRAGLAKKEPKMLEAWDARHLYDEIQKARQDGPLFVMHDGPPYANGHLHHGHILNKILKDIVVKDRTMRGFRTGFIPGWDCHGLPIEVQVDKKLGKKKADMSKAEIRQEYRSYAERFVAVQRDEFRRLGVLARWDDPYMTMSFGYEATILRELAKFVDTGLLFKGLKPVNWCTVHRTALAEAEVEYEDHTSPSVFVAFPLVGDASRLKLASDADMVIWTTTPWTLPANLAIALNPKLDYIAYPIKGRPRIFARGLAESFLAAVGEDALDETKILGQFKGADLEGLTYRHPLIDRTSPVILGDHVTLEAGTGCVHTAPGHGADDFDVGRRYGLDILSPVDDGGLFTDEAGPFAGQYVFKANPAIIAALVEAGALLNAADDQLTHRYAHCWRCHKPIILRATEQWWVAIDKPFNDGPSLRERALSAIKDVDWLPAWGEKRIGGMLEARPDWCLSRQRTWGVPIAVAYCEKCGSAHLNHDSMMKVADIFEKEGANAWFDKPLDELMGPLSCKDCGGTTFRKEEDILDVWFDSGCSYAAVIERYEEGHADGPPVDLYLEGSDQSRGWFQTSLLCSLATRERAPYRRVLTHGFIVDSQGKPYSKSKGNFVDPFKQINQSGAELLRLWVAAEDYRDDIRMSDEVFKWLTEMYRKIRNTVRYLLGNIDDFDPTKHWVAVEDMQPLDRYALVSTRVTLERMAKAYDAYEFHIVMKKLIELCTVELSAFYFDVLKDRLYASRCDSALRRSAQTALYMIARDLLRVMAPILSFTAEEAWGHLSLLDGDPSSVHLALHPGVDEPRLVKELWGKLAGERDGLLERYGSAREVRRMANGVLETARRDKLIGSSTEAALLVRGPAAEIEALQGFGMDELADLFIVSGVRLETGGNTLEVIVEKAAGTKCARCWLYREDVGNNEKHPSVCGRCVEAL